jgi:hypothetical protein
LPFSGGTAKNIVKVVSEKDITDLETKSLSDMKSVAYNKFITNRDFQTRYYFSQDQIKVEKISVDADEVGKETDTLNMTLTAKASVDAFEKSQLEPVYQELRSSLAPQGYYLDSQQYRAIPPVFSFGPGGIRAEVKVSGIARIQVDSASIKNQLMGKHISEAKKVLDGIPNVVSYRTNYTPSIMPEFLKFIPNEQSKIEIRQIYLDPPSDN